jgi:hypothetical protein
LPPFAAPLAYLRKPSEAMILQQKVISVPIKFTQ